MARKENQAAAFRLQNITPGQKALWSVHQMDPKAGGYNISFAWNVGKSLDIEVFLLVLEQIATIHPVWRSTFEEVNGEPMQKVHDYQPVSLEVVDATGMDYEEMCGVFDAETRAVVDLGKKSSIRWIYHKRKEGDCFLFFQAHHLCIDLVSFMRMVDGIRRLYRAKKAGENLQLQPPKHGIGDLICWQEAFLASADGNKQLAFWKEKLTGKLPTLDLHTDFPRPPLATFETAYCTRHLSPQLAKRITTAAKKSHTSTYAYFFTAYLTQLHRYSGQDDIMVGTPALGRPSVFNDIFHYCTSVILVRSLSTSTSRYATFLKESNRTIRSSVKNQNYPLYMLGPELDYDRDPSRTPIFQAQFIYENLNRMESREEPIVTMGSNGHERWDLYDMQWERIPVQLQTDQFEVTMKVMCVADCFYIQVSYRKDLFLRQTMERFADNYLTLLNFVIDNPDRSVAKVDLISQGEKSQTLVDWNDTSTDNGHHEMTLISLFQRQVEKSPDSLALIYEGAYLSYRNLDERANQLGHWLRKVGVGREALVAVCFDRSLEMVIALYGIHKAGGAYTPLDPEYPAERISFILADAQIKVLLTQSFLIDKIPDFGGVTLCLDSGWDEIAQESKQDPDNQPDPANLAYLIYTSGSTGKPKGVMTCHEAICNRLLWMHRAFPLFEDDRVMQKTPYCFDVSLWEFFLPLETGACLVIAKPNGHQDSGYLVKLVREQKITVLHFVPSMLLVFLEEKDTCTSLRRVICSGEALAAGLQASFFTRFPEVELLNFYGPTEAAVDVSFWKCHRQSDQVPIGKPIDNVKLYVLDARLNPVPIGVSGELFIAGIAPSRGYFNGARLTAQSFIADPYSAMPGGRLYKTGDAVRFLPDGSIAYIGRIDFQVKMRGFRIELGEIGAVLDRHAYVREALVVMREDIPGIKRLIAYLVPEQEISVPELRLYLSKHLPEYMVPSSFVVVMSFPRTANGKLDRSSLPVPELDRDQLEIAYIGPSNATEKALIRIWQEVLRLTKVGVNDNFFELGGDSILSFQIVNRAAKVGLQASPSMILKNQTVAQLAKVVGLHERFECRQKEVSGTVALTPIQTWFFERELAGKDHWNMSFMLRTRQALVQKDLVAAFACLLRHHDAFRLRFIKVGSSWTQENAVVEQAHIMAQYRFANTAYFEKVRTEVLSGLQASLNLAKGPLLRAAHFTFEDGSEGRLVVVTHHLVMDGISWRILIEDLEQILTGNLTDLAPKTTSYKDWSAQLQQYCQSARLLDESVYWQNIANKSVPALPLDLDSGPNSVASENVVSVCLDEAQTLLLLQVAPKFYRAKINDILLTALLQALSSWTGLNQQLIEMEGHGREDLFEGVDLSRTIGWFTSLFPVYLDGGDNQVGSQILQCLKKTTANIPHGGLGYGLLRYLSGKTSIEGEQAPILFNYLGQFSFEKKESLLEFCIEETGPTRSPAGERSHIFEINALVTDRRFRLNWHYSKNLHTQATVQRVANSYVLALINLIEKRCSDPVIIEAFPMMDFSPGELQNLPHLLANEQADLDSIEDIYPLSPVQTGILLHYIMAPETGVYMVQTCWQVKGDVDQDLFAKAWQAVVNRNEMLRTSFLAETREAPFQAVYRELPLGAFEDWSDREDALKKAEKVPTMVLLDWSMHTEHWREVELEKLALFSREKPLDLTRPPLMRILLIKYSEDRHELLWTNHHLIMDGWSFVIVLNDVFRFYAALHKKTVLNLPEPLAFSTYIKWQREQPNSRSEQYWRQQLDGILAPTPLGLDLPKNQLHGRRGGAVLLKIQEGDSNAILQMSKRHHITLNTFFQGIWALLLGHYSGEDEVVFGATVSGRPAELPGSDKLVGMFINTLPVRMNLQASRQLREWLQGIQENMFELRNHEHCALVDVQGWSEISRDLPLFESILVFENYPMDFDCDGSALNFKIQEIEEKTNFPLTVVICSDAKGFIVRFIYDGNRFERNTVGRIAQHLTLLLEAITKNPSQELLKLPIITEPERELLLKWNDTTYGYGQESLTLLDLFDRQLAKTPHQQAIVYEDETLSYEAFDQRVNQLGHYLRARGIGPEKRVGVCMKRSLDLVIALYGIHRAGGTFTPIDPELPEDRIAYLLDDAQVTAVLTHRMDELIPESVEAICLDRERGQIEKENIYKPNYSTCGSSMAYLIYTSGSTGNPKGVINHHEAICNRLLWMQKTYPLGESDRVMQKTPFTFDVSIWEFFWPLQTGAALVVAKAGGHKDCSYLIALIQAQKITVLHFVPAMLRVFLEDPNVSQCTRLKRVFSSGEALPLTTKNRFFACLPNCELHNLYGPTEAAVDVTFWECKPDHDSLPIGRPIDNLRIHALNRHLNPQPIGVSGELHIAGIGLARGYHNRAALTAEKFIPDPFTKELGQRLYKSGDLVRYLSDGTIDFIGRIDFQVKLRGLRIELGEISTNINKHPAVKDALVLLLEAQPGEQLLVAYLVPRKPGYLNITDIRAFLHTKLAAYMVPSSFVRLNSFPTTANGKVDRRALPKPMFNPDRLENAFVAPRNQTEELLAGIWRELLKVDRVGVHDHFFLIGGHSLIAARVVARIRRTLKLELPLSQMFSRPTIAGLAEVLDLSRSEDVQRISCVPRLPIPTKENAVAAILSSAQERLWFIDKLQPNNPAYNIPVGYRLEGKLDRVLFQQALQCIVARHEALRTTFSDTVPSKGGQEITAQIIAKKRVVEVQQRTAADWETAERLAVSQSLEPFDLKIGPLFRFTLVEIIGSQPPQQLFLCTAHHIIFDGWSLGVLLGELWTLYQASLQEKEANLSQLEIQYADYASWQKAYLESETARQHLHYWESQLRDAPQVMELPTDTPRPKQARFAGDQVPIALSSELMDQLQGRRESDTLFITLLTVFSILLSRYTGHDDMLLGTPVANRTHTELEGLIGCFVNPLVLRCKLSQAHSFQENLAEIKKMALEAYARQELPFERLLDALQPERDASRNPLFQVMFTLQNQPMPQIDVPSLNVAPFRFKRCVAHVDLLLFLEEVDGDCGGFFEFNTDLFKRSSIERMVGHLRTLIESIVAAPKCPISQLTLLTGVERRRLLLTRNNTNMHGTQALFPSLLKNRAAMEPESKAVVFTTDDGSPSVSLTYQALDERTDQLAHYLASKGVGAETLVGVYMERGLEMIVTLLGIMKAGAAYVPLDPAFPKDRLSYMVADAKLPLILTHTTLLKDSFERQTEMEAIDDSWSKIAGLPLTPPSLKIHPKNLVYVLYTSGSTGKPKGVQLAHFNLSNFLRTVSDRPGFTQQDILLAVATFSFDIAGLELYLPLLAGGQVVLATKEAAMNGRRLLELLELHKVTVMQATPITWRLMLEAGWLPGKLKVLCTGEPLASELAKKILKHCGSLWNMYGPTETTIWSTIHSVKAREMPVPIGAPIGNTQVYVVDRHLQLQPEGIAGELLIGGNGLTRSYLNRPSLTAQSFIPNPFQQQASQHCASRLYKTGDLVRWLARGSLECLGRIDNQVKIRGYRIELGEIETTLAAQPGVCEAVVAVRGESPDKHHLVGYVIPREGSNLQPEALTNALSETLPNYMVPTAYLEMTAFPLTPNKKIDRKALPAPGDMATAKADYIPPDTKEANDLAEIWGQVLGVERIGLSDNFFKIGGNSLMAMRVQTRIRKIYGIDVALVHFFQMRTLLQLSELVQMMRGVATENKDDEQGEI